MPEERRGDYFAQVAACRLGVRRIGEMIAARGVPMLRAAFDDIIRRTRERLLEALTRIPPGEYTFDDVMDDDGVGTTNIPIKLRITVPPHGSNRKVLFDFAGTGPQVKGNINSTITVTLARRALFAQGPARSGRAKQPGPDRDRRHQRRRSAR